MVRPSLYLWLALSALFGAMAGVLGITLLRPAQAAPAASTSAYMPVVLAQVPPIAPTLTTLLQTDSTFVDAKADPASGRIFLAVINRADRNRLHVYEDIGPRLQEVIAPEIVAMFPTGIDARGPPAPAYTVPGDKQAAGTILFYGGYFRLYFTGRDADDPTGPFKFKRLITNIPPPQASQ